MRSDAMTREDEGIPPSNPAAPTGRATAPDRLPYAPPRLDELPPLRPRLQLGSPPPPPL